MMKFSIFLVISAMVTISILVYVTILPQMSNAAVFNQNPTGSNVTVDSWRTDGMTERRTITEKQPFYIIRGDQLRTIGTATILPDTTQLTFERRNGNVAIAVAIGILFSGAITLLISRV